VSSKPQAKLRAVEQPSFLATLYDGKPDGYYLLVWTKDPKTGKKVSRYFKDLNEATSYAEKQGATVDTYFGLGLSAKAKERHQRVESSEVVALPGLWVDVDYINQNHRKQNLPPTEKDAIELVKRMPKQPSLIIHSGHGLQVYWLFERVELIDSEETREKLATINEDWNKHLQALALEQGWTVDSTQDLARVFRVPNTKNHKDKDAVIDVRVIHQTSTRFKPDELATALKKAATYSVEKPAKSKETIKVGTLALKPVAQIDEQKFKLLCELEPKFEASYHRTRSIKEMPDQSASAYDLSLATIAASAGWIDQELVNLIIDSRTKHGDELKLDNKQYYTRTIVKARTRTIVTARTPPTKPHAKREATNERAARLVEPSNVANIIKSKQARIEELGLTRTLADDICEQNHFALDKGDLLYVYKNGVYVPDGKKLIERRVKELLINDHLSKKWAQHRANEVIGYISADAPELWEEPSPDAINVRNGIVRIDLESGKHEFTAHTPAHLSPVQLPINYKRKATSEFWEQFISETFPDDAQEVAYQIPAWLMIPDVSLQKAILLIGEGANGKSTYLSAVRAFIGKPNTSSVSLQKIESNTFAAAQLVGKLANICPDLPSTHLESTSVFKNIVGGDSINVERKNGHAFDVTVYSRLVFSANHLPRSNDSSFAFFRRWIVLPFERTFEEGEQIPRRILDARLRDANELSGVFNHALKALPQLLSSGFSESASMVSAHSEFRRMTDPLSVWLEQATMELNDKFMPIAMFHKEYNASCSREGRPTLTLNAFGRAFKRIKPHVEKAQRVYADEKQWCYLNMVLRNHSF
jgi:putative DNA primase/helicase